MDQLFDMYARVEVLCSQAYALKDQLRNMVIADEFTMDAYHDWAVVYFETLRARVVAERRTLGLPGINGRQDNENFGSLPGLQAQIGRFCGRGRKREAAELDQLGADHRR